MINLGHLDKLAPGHKGYFLTKDKDDYINLGSGEAIKVFANYSIWSMHEPIDYDLKVNQELVFEDQTNFDSLAPQMNIKRKKLIGELQHKLTKRDNQFIPSQKVEQPAKGTPNTRILVDRGEWTYRDNERGEAELVAKDTIVNVDNKTFDKKFKDKRYSDLVNGVAKKQTEAPIDLDNLHKTKAVSSKESTYNQRLEDRYERERRAEETLADKNAKGMDWSQDMSDAELTNFMKKTGIDYEIKRREHFMHNRHTMEFTTSLGFKLNDSTQANSTGAQGGMNNEFAFALEYFLSSKFMQIERFTVEADIRKGKNEAFMGSTNATLSEFSYGLNAYWYPFKRPTALETNIFFLGLGARRGSVSADNTVQSLNYTALVLPVISAGVRYHFENQFGLRLITSMETFNLSTSETLESSSSLPTSTSYSNLKISGGVSYYF